MRVLTTGLVVIGLVLVCSQAIGAEEKTLAEWGFPPISQWRFDFSSYWDMDGDGYEETLREIYTVSPVASGTLWGMYIYVYIDRDDGQWYEVSYFKAGLSHVFYFEDLDHDGLWTRKEE